MLSYTCAHRIFLFNRAVSEQHRPINLSVIMEIFPFLFLSDTTTTSYKWPFGTWNEADENEEVDFPSHLFLMNLNPKSSMWLMVTYTWQWRSIMTRFFFNTAELFQTIQNGIRGFHLFWTKKVKSTCCSLSSTFNDYFCLKLIKRKLVWEDIYSTEQLWCPRTGSRPCLPVSVLALHWAPTWPWVNVSSLSVLVFSSAKWGHSSTNLVEQFWSFSRTVLTKPGKWDL